MSLSIKQKQVLGVTSIVALVVISLSVLQMVALTRVLLQQSHARGEVLAQAIVHSATGVVTSRESAYQEIRRDARVRAALESALYSPDVTYAGITDPAGIFIAHSDPTRVGERVGPGGDLLEVRQQSGVAQLRDVYSTGRTLEFRQPLLLDDEPFAVLRIGVSTLLVRRELDAWLRPAILTAGVALVIAVLVAIGLSHLVLRPIHVIRSSLSRLGQGDLGATLDLQGDEFKELGDVFASVSSQLRAVMPDSAKRAQLLELSRRVTALGRLTAGVAHEVKNPLNAMTIHLELVKQKLRAGGDAAAAAPHVEVIAREIRRLDDVVQGFLKFARPEELSLQPVDAAGMLEDIRKTLDAEAAAAHIVIDANYQPDTPAVEADPTILRQALLNLAKNAIQAMPGGGRLRMECQPARDRRVEIRIADTGVGIAPDHLARIFDLYFTTKEHGTGIGLSLVYRTIQLHSGDIEVESTPGVGTTFIIRLPVAGSPVAPRSLEPTEHLSKLTASRGA